MILLPISTDEQIFFNQNAHLITRQFFFFFFDIMDKKQLFQFFIDCATSTKFIHSLSVAYV